MSFKLRSELYILSPTVSKTFAKKRQRLYSPKVRRVMAGGF